MFPLEEENYTRGGRSAIPSDKQKLGSSSRQKCFKRSRIFYKILHRSKFKFSSTMAGVKERGRERETITELRGSWRVWKRSAMSGSRATSARNITSASVSVTMLVSASGDSSYRISSSQHSFPYAFVFISCATLTRTRSYNLRP